MEILNREVCGVVTSRTTPTLKSTMARGPVFALTLRDTPPRHHPQRPVLTVFTSQDVHDTLTWHALDAALVSAFAAGAQVPLRHAHALNTTDSLLIMPAWSDECIGLKTVTVIPSAPRHGGTTVGSNYLLLDRTTGALRAIMDGDALTVRRTAVVSAIAARYMARTDSTTLAMIGTGHLAPWMVRAHCALRPELQQVLLWGRNASRANVLATLLADEGLPVVAVQDCDDAVRRAHIVCCATTAHEPVVQGLWLRSGTHLDLVGGFTPRMREVDDAAIAGSRIAVDTYVGVLAEAGDVVVPLDHGTIVRSDIIAELAQLVRGEVRGRAEAAQITLFKSVGTALADLAAAQLVLASKMGDTGN